MAKNIKAEINGALSSKSTSELKPQVQNVIHNMLENPFDTYKGSAYDAVNRKDALNGAGVKYWQEENAGKHNDQELKDNNHKLIGKLEQSIQDIHKANQDPSFGDKKAVHHTAKNTFNEINQVIGKYKNIQKKLAVNLNRLNTAAAQHGNNKLPEELSQSLERIKAYSNAVSDMIVSLIEERKKLMELL